MEKNIPIPTRRKQAYDFGMFEIGDSHLYLEASNRVTAALTMWNKRHGNTRKFRTQVQKTGIRVWRIE